MALSYDFAVKTAPIIAFCVAGFASLKVLHVFEKGFGTGGAAGVVGQCLVPLLFGLTLITTGGVVYILQSSDEALKIVKFATFFVLIGPWYGSIHLAGYIGAALVPNRKRIQLIVSAILLLGATIAIFSVYHLVFS